MTPQDFFALRFYDNSVAEWLIALGIFAGITLALYLARLLVVRHLKRIAERTTTQVDDIVVDLLARTKLFFILALALKLAANSLTLPDQVHSTLSAVAVIALFMQLGVWGNGLVTVALRRYAAHAAADGSSVTTVTAFGFLARVAWWVIVFLSVLGALRLNITPLITGLGISGVAVALAVQNVLGDLFAALSIVLDKPFAVGDAIAVDALSGTVEHIGLKTTRIRSVNGEQLIFSNADLLRSRIRNLKRMRERRAVITLGAAYSTPPVLVARIPGMLREIVEAQPLARFDRAHFVAFGESSLSFEIVFWVTNPEYNAYVDTVQAINLDILRRFSEAGIDFSFPTRVVYHRGVPVAVPTQAADPPASRAGPTKKSSARKSRATGAD